MTIAVSFQLATPLSGAGSGAPLLGSEAAETASTWWGRTNRAENARLHAGWPVPSGIAPTVLAVTELQSAEVERVLLHVSDARERARVAAEQVARQPESAHLVEALRETQQTLDALHHRLTQRTFYAAADGETLKLAL
jgi:hypothetical protein